MDSWEDEGLFITKSSAKTDISAEMEGNVVKPFDISVSALIDFWRRRFHYRFLNRAKIKNANYSFRMREVWQKLGIRRQPPEERNEAVWKQEYSDEPVIQQWTRVKRKRYCWQCCKLSVFVHFSLLH